MKLVQRLKFGDDARVTPAQADFVETFALRLSEAGMQRMAARVFSALMIAPGGGLTAREIGEELSVSAGAVSGATRMLAQLGLLHRRRTPGERSDRFEVRGAYWSESVLVRAENTRALSALLADAITATDDAGARERLHETRAFFDFLVTRMPGLVEEWHEMRDSRT